MKIKVLFLALLGLSLSACQEVAFEQGKTLYTMHCKSCHMDDGSGLGANIPPLVQADYLRDNQEKLACIIRYGLADTIMVNGVQYDLPMAGIEGLTEFQIANIINYINHSWGNDYGFAKVEDLRQQLSDCE